jgi:hypothetical protein
MMLMHGVGRREMIKAYPQNESKTIRRVLSRVIIEHLTLLKEEDEDTWGGITFVKDESTKSFGLTGASWMNFVSLDNRNSRWKG